MEQNRWQEALEAARRARARQGRHPRRGVAADRHRADGAGPARESRQARSARRNSTPEARRQAREWQRFVEERIQVAELAPRDPRGPAPHPLAGALHYVIQFTLC
jgi:hypothetical protein